jgi:hypothetical protein
VTSSCLLSSDDFCSRQAYYSLRWEPPALSPKSILLRAVEHGLMADTDDWGRAASDEAMRLCCEGAIDTAETNLLGLAEHVAALADIAAWTIRTESPWERPEPVMVGDHPWTPSCFTTGEDSTLRAIVVTDRMDAMREMAMRTSWAVQGESAVYGLPVDVICVSLGAMRAGRWSNPFTSAYRHPQNRVLRFCKRDGGAFDGRWEKVWREQDYATREEWLEAMTADGVLADAVRVLTVDVPEHASDIVRLADSKLDRIYGKGLPEPQLSRCFDRVSPCPYRSACPEWREPSEASGFTALPLMHGRD